MSSPNANTLRVVLHGRFVNAKYRRMPKHWRDELTIYRTVAALYHVVQHRQRAVTLS